MLSLLSKPHKIWTIYDEIDSYNNAHATSNDVDEMCNEIAFMDQDETEDEDRDLKNHTDTDHYKCNHCGNIYNRGLYENKVAPCRIIQRPGMTIEIDVNYKFDDEYHKDHLYICEDYFSGIKSRISRQKLEEYCALAREYKLTLFKENDKGEKREVIFLVKDYDVIYTICHQTVIDIIKNDHIMPCRSNLEICVDVESYTPNKEINSESIISSTKMRLIGKEHPRFTKPFYYYHM